MILEKNMFDAGQAAHLLLPLFKNDDLPQHLAVVAEVCGMSPDRLSLDFKADFKEVAVVYAGPQRLILLGLGDRAGAQELLVAHRFCRVNQNAKIKDEAVDWIWLHDDEAISNAINGWLLGTYKIGLHKSDSPERLALTLPHTIGRADAAALEKGRQMAETQMRVMDLVNAAPNVKTPQYLADFAKKSGQTYGFEVNVLDKQACEDLGLDAFLSVNAGSAQPPFFIIMHYLHPEATKTIGLVGKGITFDTGGISIKPSSNMHLMKSDMGGAAAVLGTIEHVAKCQWPVNVVAIVPTTENMVDGRGTKPGSVIGSYAGKTIEVIDTDAEGRLILADGLTYMARHFNPDVLIDVATLTGSVIATLGYHAAGLFTNNAALGQALLEAAETTGEKLWSLPLWDAYFDDIKSDVADIANLGNKPMSGAITAAKFLEFFTEKHPNWAHLDIAGMALTTNELGQGRVATAYGVRLLTAFIAQSMK